MTGLFGLAPEATRRGGFLSLWDYAYRRCE